MWSLYNEEKFLEPLKFSNGKTQEDVVREIIDSAKSGKKIIFIRGVCGTGKSAIALNAAKKLGKTSIVVPGKGLQKQYKEDYESKKYLLKENNEKLKISIITGRNNHECNFLKDEDITIPRIKKEVNSRLNDIFEFDKKKIEHKRAEDESADNQDIPCKIEIKDKNFNKIKEYLKKNKNINSNNIVNTSYVKRVPLASVCPYWSPVLPEEYDLKNIDYFGKKNYDGINGTRFSIYQRKPGCKFYEQFNSYLDSDVIVFNAQKYKLESAINRKPLTEAEIIDECDEFLDSFSNQRTINLERFQNSMIQVAGINEKVDGISKEINGLIAQIRSHEKIKDALINNKIIPLKETPVYVLFRIFLESEEFLDGIEDESYLFDVESTVKMFEDFFDDTYLTFYKKDNNLLINVVTTNLAKRLKEMVDANKIIIFMSGTLHSEGILKNVFGLENFITIEAETQHPGEINIQRTGLEMDCKYDNFSSGRINREKYLKALDKCIEVSEKPVLVHVNSFADLPNNGELRNFGLKNLITGESLRENQDNDKLGEDIDRFKRGETKILFTTKCSRGVDFPGKQCNSIVFTKYPNPNPGDAFWKILKQTNPNQYWEFYKDKARRELLQKIYRGLRFKEDKVFLLSPDARVLNFFEREIR